VVELGKTRWYFFFLQRQIPIFCSKHVAVLPGDWVVDIEEKNQIATDNGDLFVFSASWSKVKLAICWW